MAGEITQGRYISEARKKMQMSQKDLANRVKHEDGKPISPQYLNDIERDRRLLTSEHLIRQFASVLKIEADYLHYLAGKLPEEIREKNLSSEQVMTAFRQMRSPSRTKK